MEVVNPYQRFYQPTEKDRKKVKLMAAAGIPHDLISTIMEMSHGTMLQHFRRELDVGLAELVYAATSRLAAALDEQNGLAAAMFILKTKGGWRETMRHEVHHDVSGLSDEAIETELSALRERARAVATAGVRSPHVPPESGGVVH